MLVIKYTPFKDCCTCSSGLPFFRSIILKSAKTTKILAEEQSKDSIFQVQLEVRVADIVEG